MGLIKPEGTKKIEGKGGTVVREAAPDRVHPTVDWNPGDVILDLYEVQCLLGKGGMGKVYKVLHRAWGIELAVKIPLLGGEETQETRWEEEIYQRFVTEAETWVNLGLHPHVVSCYYVRKLEGCPGVFAEYVDGGSLADRIAGKELYRGQPREVLEKLLDIAIQFAWGLEYAHAQGLVHQDVKPANVMVTREGEVKVTDFGLAKAAANLYGPPAGPTGQRENLLVSVAGMTEAYCSPEQALGGRLNHKTDTWSWGVSVLEMFTGKVTWKSGTTAADELEKYVKAGPTHAGIPAMPPPLVDILRRCFKYDPAERPTGMAEVAEQLKQVNREALGREYMRRQPKAGRDTADSLNNRAVSLLDLNHRAEAETTWQKAIQVQPHHPEATYNRNIILWRARALKEDRVLENALHEVMKTHGESAYTRRLMAMTYLELGDSRAALQTLEKITGEAAREKAVTELQGLAKAKLPYTLGLLREFKGHTGPVNAVALTPDNRQAISGGEDRTLRWWDVNKGTCTKIVPAHTGTINTLVISRDGQLAVTGSRDKTIKIWDTGNKTLLRTITGHPEAVRQVNLGADGKHILSRDIEGTVKIWETGTGQCLHTFNRLGAGNLTAVPPGWTYGPAGVKLLYIIGPGGITAWDMNREKAAGYIKTTDLKVDGFSLSEGGRYGITAHQDRKVRIWEMTSGKLVSTLAGHENEVRAVGISGDGKYAVTGGVDQTLKLWEVATGVLLHTYPGHTREVTTVSLSRDGQYVLTGSGDYTLRLWRIKQTPFYRAPMMLARVTSSREVITLQEQYEQEITAAVRDLAQNNPGAAAPHVRRARSFQGYERHRHALETWTDLYHFLPKKSFRAGWEVMTLEGHKGTVNAAVLDKGSTNALTAGADQTLKLWDTRTGKMIRTFTGHKEAVETVVMREDGSVAFSGGRDGVIKQWEVSTGKLIRTIPGEANQVRGLAISEDGRFLLVGGSNTPFLWDIAAGCIVRIFKQHPMAVNTAAMSRDGEYALTGSDGNGETLIMWKVVTGQGVQKFPQHGGYVAGADISRDGRYVIAVGGGESRRPNPEDFQDQEMRNLVTRVVSTAPVQQSAGTTIKLWDAGTGDLIKSEAGHERPILTVGFSWDGKYAITGSADATMKLWEIPTLRHLHTFQGHTGSVCSASLSRDGKYLVTGSTDGTARLWFLDWELEERDPGNWQEAIRPYIRSFLVQHTPYAGKLTPGREPSFIEKKNALVRQGKPTWTDNDFTNLLYDLGCTGYGRVKPEEVMKQLKEHA